MKEFDEIMEQIAESGAKTQEKMLINDVINIYNGEYHDYKAYLNEKQAQIDYAREQNQKCTGTFYVMPLCVSEEIFNFTKSRRDYDKKGTH